MNKIGLIVAVAGEAEFSKKGIEKAAKAFTDAVSKELVKGGKVRLVGSGTFEISERVARGGRSPKTGEMMTIEVSKTPKLKAGRALKDEVSR